VKLKDLWDREDRRDLRLSAQDSVLCLLMAPRAAAVADPAGFHLPLLQFRTILSGHYSEFKAE